MKRISSRSLLLWTLPSCGIITLAAGFGGPTERGLIGPDVIAGTVADTFGGFDMEYYGTSGGINGFAIATQSCNIGDAELAWQGGTNQTPVIVQNCYIYTGGVFRQVGMGWMKHSFCALSESESYCGSCTDNNDCDWLAIGCADTYWAGLNADANAARTLINPSTGDYDYPFSISPTGTWAMRGKLQIRTEDTDPTLNTDARWAVEAYYMAPDDTALGNHMNNASWREIGFTSDTTPVSAGTTNRQEPAIMAWHAMEPGGINLDWVDTPEAAGTGRVYVGCTATDIGNGWWHYQYAVQNLNSHRGIDRFTIPMPDCVDIQNETFTDVFYHSGEPVDGTDWPATRDPSGLEWATDSYDTNSEANAIRWSTMYTFGFDAMAPPISAPAELGMWRPGPGDSITAQVLLPSDDCNGLCIGDINDDGLVNVDDLLIVLGDWGTTGPSDADISGDLIVGVDDLLLVISGWGDCP